MRIRGVVDGGDLRARAADRRRSERVPHDRAVAVACELLLDRDDRGGIPDPERLLERDGGLRRRQGRERRLREGHELAVPAREGMDLRVHARRIVPSSRRQAPVRGLVRV